MAEKYVWLIGGSQMSVPMCNEIKSRGYKLLLTDGNPDCYCRPVADFFHPLNVYNVGDNLNFGKAIKYDARLDGYEVAAVLTIGTDAGPTVSAASDLFGLPSIGQETAKRVKNKVEMRQSLVLPHPYFAVYHRGTEGTLPDSFFPFVCKPTDQAGSRGVAIVNEQAELNAYLAANDPDELLLEELLIGEDVIPEWRGKYGFDTSEAAFDFFIEDGKVIYANGALRMFWADQPAIEAGHINPFAADEQIMELARMAARRLGVKWGPFKIDVKKDKRYGWCLLECATRLSGGYDHMYTCPLATGKDITGVMLDIALGREEFTYLQLFPTLDRVAACLAPRFEPGELLHWQQSVEADYTFITKQKLIPPLTCNQDRPAFIIASGGSRDEALERVIDLSRQLQPVYKGI